MKRTMRLLARLYPSSWRKRYGTELDALLEDATPSVRNAFDIFWGALKMQVTMWSFGGITLGCSVAGIILAVAVSLVSPIHYVSQAVFTAAPADESTRQLVRKLERSVFSRQSLTSIIQEHNLYPRERSSMPLDDVIDKMNTKIRIYPIQLASLGNRDTLNFVVQFDYPDPYVTQQVDAELAARLIEGNLEINRRLNSNSTLRVINYPSVQLRRALDRTKAAVIGLFVGLLAGLTLAILLRARQGTTAENG